MRQHEGNYRIEALDKHNRDQFSCGIDSLDRYLQQQARQEARKHVATPFVLIEPPQDVVLGYYTLSSCGVDLGEWPEALAKKLPRYALIPVTLLGRLAIDEHHHGHKLGQRLLMDALYRSWLASSQVASMAVIVDAISAEATEFYQHYDFIPFPRHAKRLFLPMQTIGTLF